MGYVNEESLRTLEELLGRCDPGPWTPLVEGRDGVSFASFIEVGAGPARGEDIYVRRESGIASAELLDFIATARNLLPQLIREVRESREQSQIR